jgi:hypothetical protein
VDIYNHFVLPVQLNILDVALIAIYVHDLEHQPSQAEEPVKIATPITTLPLPAYPNIYDPRLTVAGGGFANNTQLFYNTMCGCEVCQCNTKEEK